MARLISTERTEPVRKVSPEHMRLWHAIHDFIRQHGGAVVSIPGHKGIRIEVPKDSPLPVKLSELGYSPRHLSTGTRIQTGSFMPVDVIEITL